MKIELFDPLEFPNHLLLMLIFNLKIDLAVGDPIGKNKVQKKSQLPFGNWDLKSKTQYILKGGRWFYEQLPLNLLILIFQFHPNQSQQSFQFH